MEFVPLLATAALVLKLIDFLKLLRVVDVDAIVAQLAAWVAGVSCLFLLGATDYAGGVHIGDLALSDLNGWSKVLAGLTLGATASLIYDGKRALDRSDSAAMPSLVSGKVPVVPPPVIDAGDVRV